MVQKKITQELIDDICMAMKYYDNHGELPTKKKRIDITIESQALKRLGKCNRSNIINELIMQSSNF